MREFEEIIESSSDFTACAQHLVSKYHENRVINLSSGMRLHALFVA